MSNQTHWNDFYKKPLDDIPWEISEPPAELKKNIKNKIIRHGKALDIACGSGNYSIYLAKNGFDVVGIDFSDQAIAIAKSRANNLPVKFIVGDVLRLDQLFTEESFDFILDYSLLHHIAPSDIKKYTSNCVRLLKPKGKLLLVCYSDQHKRAKGNQSAPGKHGNIMYFRNKEQVSKLYKELEQVYYKPARLGKKGKHPAHCFLFEKS